MEKSHKTAITQQKGEDQDGAKLLLHDSLAVFQAQPLVWFDHEGNCYPLEAPDLAKEKRELFQAIDEANKQQQEFGKIHLIFEEACISRLGACLATGHSPVLHFSGHGNPEYLAIENKGAMQAFFVDQLKKFVAAGKEEGRLKLVFVSTCHSHPAGNAFLEAGVDHVVCCKMDASLRDVAAGVFTQSFYQALACKRKLKAAFRIARQAVLCSPNVVNSELEMNNFLLLPRKPNDDPYHDVDIFFEEPMRETRTRRQTRKYTMNLPPPPQALFGRQVDMYEIIKRLALDSANPRLFLVRGPKGIGKGSLTKAVCSYVIDRRRTFSVDTCEWVSPLYCTDSSLSTILRELYEMIQNEDVHLVGCKQFTIWIERFVKSAYSTCSVVSIDARELKTESAMKKLNSFLFNVFLLTHHVRVIVICPTDLDYSFSAGCLTRRLSLGPLDMQSSLKLFGNYCEFVEQGLVRGVRSSADLSEILDPEMPDGSENPRAQEISSIIGEGIPANIHEIATKMSRAHYDNLIRVGVLQLQEQIAVVSGKLRSTSSTLEKQKWQRALEALMSARDSLPTVSDLTHDPSELLSVKITTPQDRQIEEKQSDTASLSSSSSMGSVIGFEFSGANMDERTTWTEHIIRSKRQIEKLLQKLLRFGDLLDGETNIFVETIERNGRERAVVSLDCEIKLRDDLAPHDDQRVREIFGKIVRFLKKAGASDDEVEDMLIGAVYKGSLIILLEAPPAVFKMLFREFLKGGKRIMLSKSDAMYMSAMSPAFLVKGPFKLLQEKQFEQWPQEERPDAVLWKENYLSLLVPATPGSCEKLMRGGIQIETWQSAMQALLKDLPSILPMHLGSTPEGLWNQSTFDELQTNTEQSNVVEVGRSSVQAEPSDQAITAAAALRPLFDTTLAATAANLPLLTTSISMLAASTNIDSIQRARLEQEANSLQIPSHVAVANEPLAPHWCSSLPNRRPSSDPFPGPRSGSPPRLSSPDLVSELSTMSLAELQACRRELKQLLKQHDEKFTEKHGRMPVKADKEPLRPLYEKYNAVKAQIRVKEKEAQQQPQTASGMKTAPRLAQQSGLRTARPMRKTSAKSPPPSSASSEQTTSTPPVASSQDLMALKAEKDKLHQMLRSYEKDFFKKHSRQVSSPADIKPVASQYRRYKEVKKAIASLEHGHET